MPRLVPVTIAITMLALALPASSMVVLAVQGESDNWSFSSLVGCYVKSSNLCTSPKNGESCSGQFRDTLSIELEGQGYLVKLHSTQANQHVCAFSYNMKSLGGVLVDDTPFGRVLIQQRKESLELVSKGVDPTAFGLGVCGAHADISGLKFPLFSKSDEGCKRHD